jgi:hypothetical protein
LLRKAFAERCAGWQELLGKADGEMLAGTRIFVAGHGRGVYKGFERARVGANKHIVEFEGAAPVELRLRDLPWHVEKAGLRFTPRQGSGAQRGQQGERPA